MRIKLADYEKYKNALHLIAKHTSEVGEFLYFTKDAFITNSQGEIYLSDDIFPLIEGLKINKDNIDPYFGGVMININDIENTEVLQAPAGEHKQPWDTKLSSENVQQEGQDIQFPSLSNKVQFRKANYGPGLLSDTYQHERLYVEFLIDSAATDEVSLMITKYLSEHPKSLSHPSKYPMTCDIDGNHLKFSCLKSHQEYLKELVENLANKMNIVLTKQTLQQQNTLPTSQKKQDLSLPSQEKIRNFANSAGIPQNYSQMINPRTPSSSSSSNSTPEKPTANFIPSFNIQPSEKIQKETLDLKIEQEVRKQKPSDPIDLLIEKILQNKLIIGLLMQPKIDQKLKRGDKKVTGQLSSHFNQLKAEDRIETQLKSLKRDYDSKTGLQRINEQVSPNPGFYLKTDKVEADPHILDKWLNSPNNSNSKSIIESFEANLAGGLEFKRALAKLIKASFETGDFTVGNKEQFKQFLLKNSDIFNFLQKNIDNLNKPNEELKKFISDNKIKILPKQVPITEQDKKHAQERLESARKMLEEDTGRIFDVQQSTSPKGKSPRK